MVKQFEEAIGKKISEITHEDILSISENEKCLEILADFENSLEVIEAILASTTDEKVKEEFEPLKYHSVFYGTSKKIGRIFKDIEENDNFDSHKDEIINLLTDSNPLKSVPMAMVCLLAVNFEELNIQEYEEIIKRNLNNAIFEISNLNENYYPIVCEMVDDIFQTRVNYHSYFNVDLLEEQNVQLLEDVINKINDFMASLETEEPELEDVLPEELGLIDITQLGGEENNGV